MSSHPTDDTPALVDLLAQALLQRGWSLVTAESCTGGLISAACTELAGSSQWFERGFVTYSNDAKHESLGVDAALIAPVGPATPVTARLTCALEWRKAPKAMAWATGSLTAPNRAIRAASTPSDSCLASLE